MRSLNLIKMHGCENDYLFVDCFTQPVPSEPGALSRWLSARHTGVGADGLVLMCPPPDPRTDALMEIYNADGSAGGMCGNALRCVALWLTRTGRTGRSPRIQMGPRLVEAAVHTMADDGRSADVSVRIGRPEPLALAADATHGQCDDSPGKESEVTAFRTDRGSIPGTILSSVRAIRQQDVCHHGRPVTMHCVSMGNPHAVLFVKYLESIEFLRLGPVIEHHPIFADRTNVEFATVTGANEARVRVWERGSGETRACGSGACAVAAAGIAAGWFSIGSPVRIRMNGGLLQTTVDTDGTFSLRGNAVEVAVLSVHL